MEYLPNLSVVVLFQLIFFIVHAAVAKEKANIFKYLSIGILLGLPFGIAFDFIFGKSIGVFDYGAGFVLWFLFVNGFLSYGIMMANVLLLKHYSLLQVYLWSIALGFTYEVVNWKFPVWEWTFSSETIEYLVVIFAAYAGLTWLMMGWLRLVRGIKFKLF
ncbi:MAG: hypothetical protein H6779_03860 [Candidatus Nomurabacteria bacterium]|nr:MAG: hypothetical protein H6779_03860 [Candidatus Nomurabacteria bacterium]